MAKAPKDLPEWRITMIRAKLQDLGRVRAHTADEAIEAAIREFRIDKAHQTRLIATRVD
jgi:hypothetical protein